MFKTLREQYIADQEQKRAIRAEQWAQGKRWKEEDRAVRLKAQQENSVDLAEHNVTMKTAASVSYLTLVCHEDTWTFIAKQAFGFWCPDWDNSELEKGKGPWDWNSYDRVRPNPNLTKGRIKKLEAGMQEVLLSGHNLVRILETLRNGTEEVRLAHAARCKTLYGKLAQFVALVDPALPTGQSTGVPYRIDDSLRQDPA
ncbi:hypothetical protein ABZ502_29955 [Streptomyces abikoensis]|uniref:hypothetical protein n=1 Tax=Streptomyces abikoensis TaxID=97398 RepID=UPI003410EC3A